MRPFTTGSDFVYQIDLETDEGSERIKAAYGANYERLVAVKNKYDPTNLFRHNQNIKPTVSGQQWVQRRRPNTQRFRFCWYLRDEVSDAAQSAQFLESANRSSPKPSVRGNLTRSGATDIGCCTDA